jgi:pyruvate ferredoxin oxidoreductase gamma subunit
MGTTGTAESESGVTEIRWHARGGQGAKTAATFLAESAVDAGLFAQGFPEYGPERMGAPMRAYNRIAHKPLRVNAPVKHPGIVVLMDETLLDTVDITEGATDKTIFLLNTASSDIQALQEKVRAKLGDKARVYVVNADKIAVETIGRPIPNTPMVGAMLRATNVLPVETVIEGLRHKLGKKFPPKVVEGNVAAVRRAFEEVIQL